MKWFGRSSHPSREVPDGMITTQADVVNADLLSFIKS
jgi:hypothetical protein